MNHIQIAELLDRYWEGETTLVEERRIKDYFASGVVDDRFRDVAPLFQALNKAQLVNAPENLGKRIGPAPLRVIGFNGWKQYMAAAVLTGIIAIGGWMYATTNPTTVVAVEPVSTPVKTQQQQQAPTADIAVAMAQMPPKVKLKKPVSSRPAVNSVEPTESTITEAEALQAVEEIKAALALVSRKFNKGKNDATKNLNKVELVDHYFKQG